MSKLLVSLYCIIIVLIAPSLVCSVDLPDEIITVVDRAKVQAFAKLPAKYRPRMRGLKVAEFRINTLALCDEIRWGVSPGNTGLDDIVGYLSSDEFCQGQPALRSKVTVVAYDRMDNLLSFELSAVPVNNEVWLRIFAASIYNVDAAMNTSKGLYTITRHQLATLLIKKQPDFLHIDKATIARSKAMLSAFPALSRKRTPVTVCAGFKPVVSSPLLFETIDVTGNGDCAFYVMCLTRKSGCDILEPIAGKKWVWTSKKELRSLRGGSLASNMQLQDIARFHFKRNLVIYHDSETFHGVREDYQVFDNTPTIFVRHGHCHFRRLLPLYYTLEQRNKFLVRLRKVQS